MVYSILSLAVLDRYGNLRQRSLQASPETACEETLHNPLEYALR